MAGVNRFACRPWRPLPPDVERTADFFGNAGSTPQRQLRASDGLASGAVGFVVGKIGVAAGPVILAMSVDARGLGECRAVVVERARIKGGQILSLGPACHFPFKIFDRYPGNEHFRKRLRLRE